MERLDASAEHLGRLRHVLDARHRRSPARSRNAAVPPEETISQPSSARPRAKLVDAVLVPDADQRTRQSSLTTSGSSRCSTAWIRSTSVSRGSTGDLLLHDHRPGVEALVDVVDGHAGRLDAGGERVVDRVRAGEGGQQRGVDVDDAAREAVEERRRQQVHVAGEHDELDAVLLEPGRHHEVALRRGRRGSRG